MILEIVLLSIQSPVYDNLSMVACADKGYKSSFITPKQTHQFALIMALLMNLWLKRAFFDNYDS